MPRVTLADPDHWEEGLMANVILIVFGWFSVIGGARSLFEVWSARRKVKESRRWPCAVGRIVRSEVVSHRTENIKGRRHSVYVPCIEYEYTVDRRPLRGSAVCLGSEVNTSSRHRAATRCCKYPVGATVDVFYDPIKPEDACLIRTMEGLWFIIPMSTLFLLIGLFIVSGAARSLAERAWNFMS